MMMETCVYTREYLYVKHLRDSGKMGKILFCAAPISRRWPAANCQSAGRQVRLAVCGIVENRPAFPDVYTSANWTSAGICAHKSAIRGGEKVYLPEFR